MKLNYLILSILFILILPLSSATLGIFKQNQCIQLLGSSDAASMNISSITYPNNASTTFVTYPMTKNDKTFNYTFCDTEQLGQYSYNYYDSNGDVWVNDFTINPQGKDYANDGIVYGIMFILLVVLLIGSIYAFTEIPFDNPMNEYGAIVGIDWKKYLKIGALTVSYVTTIALSYFAWNLSYGILQFTEMANIFYVIYRILMIGLYLVVPVCFVFVIALFVKDLKLQNLINRGLTAR